MTLSILAYGVAGWLLLVGLYGVVTSRNLIHLVACLGVAQSSTYVLLLAVGFRAGAGPPVFPGGRPAPAVDPVVQALVLTDGVVSAAITAVLLALAIQAHKRTGTLDPEELRAVRG